MAYIFSYYSDEFFDQIERLILNSDSIWGVHSAWANNKANWEQTTRLWFEEQKLAAVAISVGAWQGRRGQRDVSSGAG